MSDKMAMKSAPFLLAALLILLHPFLSGAGFCSAGPVEPSGRPVIIVNGAFPAGGDTIQEDFDWPVSMAATVDRIFILDRRDLKVRSYDKAGNEVGTRAALPYPPGGIGPRPLDMALDPHGNLWVLDEGSCLLLCFDALGRIIKTLDVRPVSTLPLRISAIGGSGLLVEDGNSGRIVPVSFDGTITGRLPDGAMAGSSADGGVFVSGKRIVPNRIPLFTVKSDGEIGNSGLALEAPEPISGTEFIGNDTEGRSYFIVVSGPAEDCATMAVAIALRGRRTLGSTRVPISPGFAVNRYACVSEPGVILYMRADGTRLAVEAFTIPLKP